MSGSFISPVPTVSRCPHSSSDRAELPLPVLPLPVLPLPVLPLPVLRLPLRTSTLGRPGVASTISAASPAACAQSAT